MKSKIANPKYRLYNMPFILQNFNNLRVPHQLFA